MAFLLLLGLLLCILTPTPVPHDPKWHCPVPAAAAPPDFVPTTCDTSSLQNTPPFPSDFLLRFCLVLEPTALPWERSDPGAHTF